MNKIKVVWICSFSNSEIRAKIPSKKGFLVKFLYRLISKDLEGDSAQWNTNNIKEFENFTDRVNLHIICPTRSIKKRFFHTNIRGINYHFFKEENTNLIKQLFRFCFTRYSSEYKINRKRELKLINEINPDIIHLIGAECSHFAKVMMDIPKIYPTISQLQTLVHNPQTIALYPDRPRFINYRLDSEKRVLQSTSYIGTDSKYFQSILPSFLDPIPPVLNLSMGSGGIVDLSEGTGEFDFVYFASYIHKAFDLALEAFALAHEKHPEITLDVIGGYSIAEKKEYDNRIKELGLEDAITFEGRLETIDDVMKQIKKSKFALVPIKVDIISGVILQAMSHGLPVVTCITPGTPEQNKKRESILLSPVGDHQAMADNMIKLIENPDYAKMLIENAALTYKERLSKVEALKTWVDVYYACIENHKKGTPFPKSMLL